MNLAAAIERMEAAGMSSQDILTAVKCIAPELSTPVVDAQAERRRAADRERKRLRNSAESAESAEADEQKGFDKEKSPTPPKEITSKKGNTQMREGIVSDEQLAFDAWNELADELDLSKAQVLNPERRKALKNRLNECGGLTGWLDAMAKIRGSPFCRGDNDKGWKADLDFVLQRKSFTRLMEGSYDERTQRGKTTGNSRASNQELLDAIVREAERREAEAGGGSLQDVDARAA